MKQKFVSSWIRSKQPRKQRKYRANAPLHLKHKFLSSALSKLLRQKHGKRSIPVRKGDEVIVMRGSFRKKKARVSMVDLKNSRVTLENILRTKKDGSKVSVYFSPSSLQITSLNLEDRKRLSSTSQKMSEEKNAPKKADSNN